LLEHQITASARTGLTRCRVPSQILDQRRLRPSHRPLQNRKIHVDSAALTHQPCLDLRCRLAVSGVREVALLFRRWRARDVRRTNLQAFEAPLSRPALPAPSVMASLCVHLTGRGGGSRRLRGELLRGKVLKISKAFQSLQFCTSSSFFRAVSSEPSEPETSERVEPHKLTRV
jgi:hypothetical protein